MLGEITQHQFHIAGFLTIVIYFIAVDMGLAIFCIHTKVEMFLASAWKTLCLQALFLLVGAWIFGLI